VEGLHRAIPIEAPRRPARMTQWAVHFKGALVDLDAAIERDERSARFWRAAAPPAAEAPEACKDSRGDRARPLAEDPLELPRARRARRGSSDILPAATSAPEGERRDERRSGIRGATQRLAAAGSRERRFSEWFGLFESPESPDRCPSNSPSRSAALPAPAAFRRSSRMHGFRTIADPTVVIETRREGASVCRDYGMPSSDGRLRPGASRSRSGSRRPADRIHGIEPVGGGIFTTETEIRFPEPHELRRAQLATKVGIGRHGSRLEAHGRGQAACRVDDPPPGTLRGRAPPDQAARAVCGDARRTRTTKLVGLSPASSSYEAGRSRLPHRGRMRDLCGSSRTGGARQEAPASRRETFVSSDPRTVTSAIQPCRRPTDAGLIGTRRRMSHGGCVRSFGAKVALHPIDLDLGPGLINFGIIAPERDGKSTLLRRSRARAPDAGEARIRRHPPRGDGTACAARHLRARRDRLFTEMRAATIRMVLRGRDLEAAAAARSRPTSSPSRRVRPTATHERQLLLGRPAPNVGVRIRTRRRGPGSTRQAVLERLATTPLEARRSCFSHHLGEVDRL